MDDSLNTATQLARKARACVVIVTAFLLPTVWGGATRAIFGQSETAESRADPATAGPVHKPGGSAAWPGIRAFDAFQGELTLDWKCEAGHTFRAPGQVEPHPCTSCGRPAYPFGTWRCLQHGEFEVLVHLQLDAQGILHPWEYRILPDGEWAPAGETLKCPVCGERLKRKFRDPLGDLPRRKKKRSTTSPRSG